MESFLPTITIPNWVHDHNSFRRWARSPESPEKVNLAFYRNALWVDRAPEEFVSHNQIKAEVCTCLMSIPGIREAGRVATHGVLVSVPEVGLSTMPDGLFVSYKSLSSGRVKAVGDSPRACVELEGPPEMVLEVVSDSSETKDFVDLVQLYRQAGVREYWLIDVRRPPYRFQLFRWGYKKLRVARRFGQRWRRSKVFDRYFRLTVGHDPMGELTFTLEMK